MAIRIKNFRSIGNGGHGMAFYGGEHDVEIDGGESIDNSGDGLRFGVDPALFEKYGLPSDIDPQELASLLTVLQEIPPEQRHQAVESSGLFQRMLARVPDALSVGANIVTMAGAENVKQLIKMLLG
jgi:hypothetical protein